jgi:hypothetical protein
MIVRDLMRTSPKSCTTTTNLAAVTELLWTCGCGALPVVDSSGGVLGTITIATSASLSAQETCARQSL